VLLFHFSHSFIHSSFLFTGRDKQLPFSRVSVQSGLPRLERRRVKCDLIETYKIMNEKYDISHDLFFKLEEDDRRGHEHTLFKKRFRL